MTIAETAANEPMALQTVFTTAVTGTLALLLYLGVDPELVAAITLAASGWIAAGFALIRSKVTPTSKVALTKDDVDLINASQAQVQPPTGGAVSRVFTGHTGSGQTPPR